MPSSHWGAPYLYLGTGLPYLFCHNLESYLFTGLSIWNVPAETKDIKEDGCGAGRFRKYMIIHGDLLGASGSQVQFWGGGSEWKG